MSNIMDKFGVPLPSGRNVTMSQPKVKNKFRVVVYNFGTVTNEKDYIAMNVDSVDRPSVEFETFQLQYFDSNTSYHGKHNWKPITLTIRDSVDNLAAKAVYRQLQKQLDFHRRISAKSEQKYSGYKFKMMIETTGGANPDDTITNLVRNTAVDSASTILGDVGLANDIDKLIGGKGYNSFSTLEKWMCYGCMITDFSFDTISYSSSEYITIKLTIKPDSCEQYDMIEQMYSEQVTSSLSSDTNTVLDILNKTIGGISI